jgi:hypothetical protein
VAAAQPQGEMRPLLLLLLLLVVLRCCSVMHCWLSSSFWQVVICFMTPAHHVYAQYKHHPEVSRVFGGPAARLVVAYTKHKSIASRLILVQH